MSIYRFSDPSPVREVVFRYANDRPPVGLLTSPKDASPEQLMLLRRALESRDWQCVPVFAEGREVLQISGFEAPAELFGALRNYQFVKGEPDITPEEGDDAKRTIAEWAQSVGIKAGGVLNLIGDVSLLASGIMSGRSQEIVAGTLYTAGAGVAACYGNVKTEHHVRQVLEQTADFLQKQAGKLPEESGLFTLLKHRRQGVISDAENFFYRYPADIMLGAYTLGAATMLQSGIRQGNPWDIAYGTSSVAMKATSLLIPEKQATQEEKAAAGPFGKFVHWVQEKPMRIFGFGSLVTDTLLGLSAFREYRNNPKQRSYIFKGITTGTYVLADVLFAISNKSHDNADGKFDVEEQRRIEALVAESIARQPEERREDLVQQVAAFLSLQPEMQGKADDIVAGIREQLAHLKNNPWVSRSSGDTPAEPARA